MFVTRHQQMVEATTASDDLNSETSLAITPQAMQAGWSVLMPCGTECHNAIIRLYLLLLLFLRVDS